jgi:hypothetical protein
MPLKYALYSNNVSKEKGTFRAMIKKQHNRTLDYVLDRMEDRHSTIVRFEAEAAISLFFEVVGDILEDGDSINTPLFHIKSSISGKFLSHEDRFYSKRHKVNMKLRPGKLLKEVAQKIKTQKIESRLPVPIVDKFMDMISGTENKHISPGGSAMVYGRHLDFDMEDEKQGVYFVGEAGTFKVDKIIRKVYSYIWINIPNDMTKGKYRLEVRSNMKTKTLRTGEFQKANLVVDEA